MRFLLLACFVAFPALALAQSSTAPRQIVLDDFESYRVGALPVRWKYLEDNQLVPLEPRLMRPKEQWYVVDDRGNKVVRVYTEGEAVHLTMANEADGFDWDITTHPILAWDWRALRLPTGAKEDREKTNDTGAAVYVLFSFDGLLFKRPKAIKYTYSSSLPVGTVATYGKLKVVVVSSALDGIGPWQTIVRDVAADYRRFFGEEPPARPLSVRLWGDSDNTDTIGEADFDNVRFLARGSR
jgi:hypothetical protein